MRARAETVDLGQVADFRRLFEALIASHQFRLARYIRTLLPRLEQSEEVLQRTVAALWEHFCEFDQTRPFYPWAERFAYYECLNFRKERARDRLVFGDDVMAQIAQARADMEGLLELRQAALKQCLEHVPPRDLELLRRRYCSPETITVLAAELDTTRKSLYRRLDRLRAQLAECITRRLAKQAPQD